MDSNSNTPAQKKVIKVDFPNYQETGFGWNGEFTREAWRKACLDNFLAGKEVFEAWQAGWKGKINKNLPKVSLAAILTYEDGSKEAVLAESYQRDAPYSLDFVAHFFEENVEASDFTFEQITYFSSASFIANAYLDSATFTEYADFSSAVFIGEAVFSSTKFTGYVYFSNSYFTGDADFRNVNFIGLTYFTKAKFTGDADFSNAKFTLDAYFSKANFKAYADFSRATFTGDADFRSAQFLGIADFSSVIFIENADFINAKFTENTDFSCAKFTGDAFFFSTMFGGDTYFSLATFQRLCFFQNHLEILKNKRLKQTCFAGIVDFENAIFVNVGHFEGVRFEKYTPAFRGCQIDSTRLEFSDDSYFPRYESSDDAVKNISFLKRLSDEHGQTDQALNFNAMELRAKRLQTEPQPASWSFRAITWLYEKIADYGRSFIRPLLAYLGLISITYILALIAAANNSPQDCKGELWRVLSDFKDNGAPSCLSAELPEDKLKLNGYRAALEYTTYRAAGILDFSDNDKQTVAVAKRLFNADVEPTWMRFWGIFKAIASAALLFLAALGLRNKYRIK